MLIDTSKTPGDSPLAALSKGFAEDLRRQGYAPRTISEAPQAAQRSERLAAEAAARQRATCPWRRSIVSCRIAVPPVPSDTKTRKALGPILGYLRGLGLAPAAEAPVEDGPAGEILNRYRRFLTTERGLAPVTALRYIDCLRPFLDRRMSADGISISGT